MRLVCALFVFFHLHAFSCNSTSPPQYVIVDLGINSAFRNSRALGINDHGEVVGYWHGPLNRDDSDRRAFFWKAGTLTDIGTLGGTNSEAHDISEQGFVVGAAQTAGGDEHAFSWLASRAVKMVDMDGSPTGARRSAANSVVDYRASQGSPYQGWAAGSFTPPGSETRAASFSDLNRPTEPLFTVNTRVFADQPEFAGAGRVNGNVHARSGYTIVGARGIGRGKVHAFVQFQQAAQSPDRFRGNYSRPVFRDLGTLPGTDPADTDSEAYDVNRNEAVVGYSGVGGGRRHAFLNPGFRAPMVDLGTLHGGANSEARALTNAAQPLRIVGFSDRPGGGNHAVLWWGLVPYDLNGNRPDGTPLLYNNGEGRWELVEAHDINENGWIVGWGRFDGQERAFLLKPR